MKRVFVLMFCAVMKFSFAQNPTPAPANTGSILISGGTIHVGDGTIIENGFIRIEKNKIVSIGSMTNVRLMKADKMIDATGKQIYPGLIALNTTLGLLEIEEARATRDNNETGVLNPNVRSIIAYNTDSKIIPTVKSNGVLLAQVVPQGGWVSGLSSVTQLDAWNWEDAVVNMDEGLQINFPSLTVYRGSENSDELNNRLKQINEIEQLFNDAKSYANDSTKKVENLKLAAVVPCLNGSRKVYMHVHTAKEILAAIGFIKKYKLNGVLVEAEESYLVANEIADAKIPVVLTTTHSMPMRNDDDIQQPYKTPGILQKAGVLFCLTHKDWSGNQRNLAFQAGTAAAYGLTKEQALQAITINAAKIVGIDKNYGTLEAGKDATLLICSGDLLDMQSSKVEKAFIAGREVVLANTQLHLYEKYKKKYGVN